MAGRQKAIGTDVTRGWRFRSPGPFHPDPIVVEGGAAERRDRVGAGERIDAAAVLEARVGKYRFGDENPAPDAREHGGVQPHFTAPIAEPDLVAMGAPEGR